MAHSDTVQPPISVGALDKDKKISAATTVGALLTAFLASLCCVGPLVFALLGIGGAGLLVKFEPYRPIFAVATLALLGAGFYFTYRKPKAATVGLAEGDACGCPAPKTNKTGRVMLWISTVLVVGFLIFPYITPWLFG